MPVNAPRKVSCITSWLNALYVWLSPETPLDLPPFDVAPRAATVAATMILPHTGRMSQARSAAYFATFARPVPVVAATVEEWHTRARLLQWPGLSILAL